MELRDRVAALQAALAEAQHLRQLSEVVDAGRTVTVIEREFLQMLSEREELWRTDDVPGADYVHFEHENPSACETRPRSGACRALGRCPLAGTTPVGYHATAPIREGEEGSHDTIVDPRRAP